MSSQFCAPVLRQSDGKFVTLRRLPLEAGDHAEKVLQDLLFEHPSLLPIEEVDSAFRELVPICTEFSTAAGRIDILYATPTGRLAFVETKLWRNPEARRVVVAQVVDYAAELSTWSLEKLDAQVVHRTKHRLFELVRAHYPNTSEAAFHDGIASSLRLGRFLLLVCGDGIHQGTEKIAAFLNQRTALDFTFALVELALFTGADGEMIAQGRVLARTERIVRELYSFSGEDELLERAVNSETVAVEDSAGRSKRLEAQAFWIGLWSDVAERLRFSDARHLTFKPERRFRAGGNWGSDSGFMFTYFDSTAREIGVSASLEPDRGREVFLALQEERSLLEAELGRKLTFGVRPSGRFGIGFSRSYLDPRIPDNRAEAVDWFVQGIEDFDRVIRARLQEVESE